MSKIENQLVQESDDNHHHHQNNYHSWIKKWFHELQCLQVDNLRELRLDLWLHVKFLFIKFCC
jgi:hypothetical protein